ncbi:hypothetical protein GE21DRAFT_1287159 [Neurospora crassa]|nr:hypothetical protein GE21DRAFT_1287159 [Neurospora crassa]
MTKWLRLFARIFQEPDCSIFLESGVSNGAKVAAHKAAQPTSNSRRLLIHVHYLDTTNMGYH